MVWDFVQSWHQIRVRYCAPTSLAIIYCIKPIHDFPGAFVVMGIDKLSVDASDVHIFLKKMLLCSTIHLHSF